MPKNGLSIYYLNIKDAQHPQTLNFWVDESEYR